MRPLVLVNLWKTHRKKLHAQVQTKINAMSCSIMMNENQVR